MVGPAAEIMMFTVKPKNKTTQDRDVPMVQPGRSASMKAAITKKTSVRDTELGEEIQQQRVCRRLVLPVHSGKLFC